MPLPDSFLSLAVPVARHAGEILLRHYRRRDLRVQQKADASLVTEADLESSAYCVIQLEAKTRFPVVSEEAIPDGSLGDSFWLVDPLDGTHEFVEHTDEFTVNLALVQKGVPVVGVIFAPTTGELYAAEAGMGVYFDDGSGARRIEPPVANERVLVRSRHHDKPEVGDFAQKARVSRSLVVGAALKFGRLVRGEASLYLRYAPSGEWDTAAGHCLLLESGGGMIDLRTREAPAYGKPGYLNAPFLAWAKGINGPALFEYGI